MSDHINRDKLKADARAAADAGDAPEKHLPKYEYGYRLIWVKYYLGRRAEIEQAEEMQP